MSRPQAVPTVQVDNERVIVTEWRFAPGAETGFHRHGYDYVVVPMTTGPLLLQTPEGEVTSQLVAGRAYSRPAGVEHNVINAHEGECVFVEIEIKTAAGAASPPCTVAHGANP
ncbi:cupin domain-containing protein [Cupriavidus gilardii]|uniref:Cupin domain-containing protein n=1 Tax=Cupriavidus gilardii TaxID=82541 RepID=A0A6N1BAL6_9BURK|nr:cupin domain-containing protein [Cupriavidus gilardii]QQE09279.1 cupin domain-containing protein [Cupriavidus sp. ISTL7]KAB0596513.1 cupin domain-containing protein [Cupriavidus gilardii]MCT9016531.1 cupin domain-containing protein [Cupriavidus gilardii]MCT9053046.1 cupin domain-containing protein [Cupriavidus gilardii]MCT9070159.1 cupin domain-containing protein [Cupriavidus gilardii]